MKASTGGNTVNVGIVQKRLGPGVDDRRETHLGSEILGTKGHFLESLRYSRKEQMVGVSWIGQEQRMKDIRDGENEMIIRRGKQVLPLVLDPAHLFKVLALGAVTVAARIIRDLLVAAMITLLNVTAQGCRTARGDGSNNSGLLGAET